MRSRILGVLAVAVVCVVAVASAQADYISTVLGDNPFLYYRMQEPNVVHGTTIANSGTTGLGGTYQIWGGNTAYGNFTDVAGMTPALTPGKLITRSSDTKGASITMAAQGSLYGALPAFTIEFLLKPTDYSGNQTLLGKTSGTGAVRLAIRDAHGYPELNMDVQGNPTEVWSGNIGTAAPIGQWSHVAVTYEASGGNSLAKFYVNGVLQNPGGSAMGGATNANLNSASYVIGYWPAANGWYFNNALDEYAIYPTALSGTTIAGHYAQLVPEPSTLALLAAGLAGLLCYAWRKRR